MRCGLLLQRLGLPEEAEDRLVAHLGALEMAGTDFQALSGPQSNAAALDRAYLDSVQDLQSEIKSELTPKQYDTVRDYLQTYPAREELDGAMAAIDTSPEPLSDADAGRLEQIWMQQARAQIKDTGALIPRASSSINIDYGAISGAIGNALSPTQRQWLQAFMAGRTPGA